MTKINEISIAKKISAYKKSRSPDAERRPWMFKDDVARSARLRDKIVKKHGSKAVDAVDKKLGGPPPKNTSGAKKSKGNSGRDEYKRDKNGQFTEYSMIDQESVSSLVINLLDEAARGVIRKKYSAVGGVKRVKRSVNVAQANKNSGQTPRQRARSAIKRNKTKRKEHGRIVTKQQIRKTARAMNKRPD